MFPGCIRAPRSIQGSTDDITKQTKSIVQAGKHVVVPEDDVTSEVSISVSKNGT
ncbi:hypothetical protein HUJ05_011631 [Dendroctonus ponderosae]|nr:hypothetical protein HUJ05_011631 [Dendroctonus ponderosae]